MLAIKVHFPRGVYCGASRTDRSVAEAFPSPARLFSAMVSAGYASQESNQAREALLWLEAQKPPAIHHPEYKTYARKHFVPVNDLYADSNKGLGLEMHPRFREKTRKERFQLTATYADPNIYYIWQEAKCPEHLQQLLPVILREVTYLGSSHCPVIAELDNEPPSPNLWPTSRIGQHMLGVPKPGRLAVLDHYHQAEELAPLSYQHGYVNQKIVATTTVIPKQTGPFGELLAFRLIQSPYIGLEQMHLLTQQSRNTLLKIGGEHTPACLHGHGAVDSASRVAIVPLAHVASQHAEGRIIGLGFLIPHDLPSQERSSLLDLLGRFKDLTLDGKTYYLEPPQPLKQPQALWQSTWSGPSASWATVTPVILDRHCKTKRPKLKGVEAIAEKAQRIERYHQNLEQEIQDILTRGLKQAGYPTPTQIVIGKHGFLTGVPSTSEFVWAKPEKPEYRMFVHVSLQFNESLLGPLLLGSGRFQGFGLFRPIGGQDAHSQ